MRPLTSIFICVLFCFNATAQNVGIGTSSPKPSAALEISSTTKRVLIPRMTTAQRNDILSPEVGLLVFDIDKGTVYMFESTSWVPLMYSVNGMNLQTQIVQSPYTLSKVDQSGYSTAISGNHAAVSAPELEPAESTDFNDNYGGVVFMDKLSGSWKAKGLIRGSVNGGQFGYSIDMQGDLAVIGAPFADVGASDKEGAVDLYKRNAANIWVLLATLTGSNAASNDNFGSSVAIHNNLIVVGAPNDDIVIGGVTHIDQGSVYIYHFNGTSWVQRAKLFADDGVAEDWFGYSVDIKDNSNGDFLLIGAPGRKEDIMPNKGIAYVYVSLNDPINWIRSGGEMKSSAYASERFGSVVAIGSSAINAYLVMAPFNTDAAAVYIFNQDLGGAGKISLGLTAINPKSYSMATEGNKLAIGVYNRSMDDFSNVGLALVYELRDSYFNYNTIVRTIYDPTPLAHGNFGWSVALSGGNLVITTSSLDEETHFVNIE